MKAEELRIGNTINYLGKHVNCTAETIYAVSKIIQPSVMYLGIPLTEEWLLNIGFEKKGNIYENWTMFTVWVNPDVFDGFIADWADKAIREVKYVHELQNLYFSLTGEELNLNKLL